MVHDNIAKSYCCGLKKKMAFLNNRTNRLVVIWTTLVGGFVSSLVKWGSEVNMPPRMPNEISPPGAHIEMWGKIFGISQHSLDYVYQGKTVSGMVSGYHWLFSFVFAFVYVMCSAICPRVRAWYGALYGIVITVVFHGFLIPLFGFRDPAYADGKRGWLWNLNAYEHISEFLGHMYWSVSIELCMIVVLVHLGRPFKGDWVVHDQSK